MIARFPRPLAALFAGLIAVAAAGAQAQDIKVQHAKGETTVPANPKKVLVFDVASLDTLDALGVRVSGVPTARLPDYLSKHADERYEKIGTLFEPDYEAVNASEPDLIIVGGRSGAKYADLAKIAPTIDMTVDPKNYVDSVRRNVRLLGTIFGKQAEADARLAKLDASVADLRKHASAVGNGLLVLTTGGKMSAYGPGSRFGVLHTDFGVEPAVRDLATTNHGQAITSEFILKVDPDWLFVIDRDAAIGRASGAAKRLLDNELVAQTSAWKNDRVVYLDPFNWYVIGGGVQAMQQTVDQIARSLGQR